MDFISSKVAVTENTQDKTDIATCMCSNGHAVAQKMTYTHEQM